MSKHKIKNVPIFKVGIHNDKRHTLKDLKEMVDNFFILKEENPDFQIPIKIGHDTMLGDEKEAMGWMDNLKTAGEFILADFSDLAEKAHDLIKDKTFKNRSIEIIPNFINAAGKKIGNVISGIALLGSSLPAVNLPDIKFSIPEALLAYTENMETENIKTSLYEDDYKASLNKKDISDKSDDNSGGHEKVNKKEYVFKLEKENAANYVNVSGIIDTEITVGSFNVSIKSISENSDSFSITYEAPEKFDSLDNTNNQKELEVKVKALFVEEKKDDTEDTTEEKPDEEKESGEDAEEGEDKGTDDSEDEEAPDKETEEKINNSKKELLDALQTFSKNPKKIQDIIEKFESTTKEYAKKIESITVKEKETHKQEIESFTRVLIKENKIYPAEKDLIKTLLFNLDNEKKIEFSYSKYDIKSEDTLLNTFKKFLSNLPKQGLFAEQGHVEDMDLDSVIASIAKQEFGYDKKDLESSAKFKEVLAFVKHKRPDLWNDQLVSKKGE